MLPPHTEFGTKFLSSSGLRPAGGCGGQEALLDGRLKEENYFLLGLLGLFERTVCLIGRRQIRQTARLPHPVPQGAVQSQSPFVMLGGQRRVPFRLMQASQQRECVCFLRSIAQRLVQRKGSLDRLQSFGIPRLVEKEI